MFEQLFPGPKALARQRDGPLAEQRQDYLAHLAQQGMSRGTLCEAVYYLLIVAQQLRLAQRPEQAIALSEVQRQATHWASRPDRKFAAGSILRARKRFLRTATSWLRLLGRLQEPRAPPHPYTEQIGAFTDFLQRERGLSQQTIDTHRNYLQRSLDYLALPPDALPQLTLVQIDRAFMDKIGRAGYEDCCLHLRARPTWRSCRRSPPAA